MKRTFFAFVALLTITAVVFVATLVTILPTAEQVSFSANPLYTIGDPSSAHGLRLVAETQMDGQLYWTTTFTPAQSPSSETQFHFSPQTKGIDYTPVTTDPQLSIQPSFSLTVCSGDLFDTDDNSLDVYRDMVQDVASRAPAGGGSYTETVTLNDYLEFCPISVECYDWPGLGSANYQAVDLSSVFSIPMDAGVTAEVTVTIQPDGAISGFSFFAADLPYLSTRVVYFQDAFYVAFPYNGLDMELDDTDVIPGLYRLPLMITDDDTAVVDVSNVELVAPMDTPAQAMALIGQGPQLALVTSANQSHPNQLTLFDLTTGIQRQQFDLENTDRVQAFSAAEDHILYMGSQQEQTSSPWTVEAWRLQNDGSFTSFISTTVPNGVPFYSSSITSLLQGDTLYTLSHPSGGACTFITVGVYDSQGCQYYADLTLSQNQDSYSTQHPVTLTDLRLEYTPTS